MIETNVNFLINPKEVNFKFNQDLFELLHSSVNNSSINFEVFIMDESGKYDCSLDSEVKIHFLKKIFDESIYRLELLTIINIFINFDHRILNSLSQTYYKRTILYNDICKECFEIANNFKSPNLKIKFHRVFLEYLQIGLHGFINDINKMIISNIYSDLILQSEDIDFDNIITKTTNQIDLNELDENKIDKNDNTDQFYTDDQKELILEIFEKLHISKSGKYILGKKGYGSIRGVIELLREENKVPKTNLIILCSSAAKLIGLNVKKIDYSDKVETFKKLTLDHLNSKIVKEKI